MGSNPGQSRNEFVKLVLKLSHNGFMATPKLGYRMYGYTLWGRIALLSYQSAQTLSSEQNVVQVVNVQQGDLPPNPREFSNYMASERNIQRITMCPPGYHHNGLWQLMNLGTGCAVTRCGEGLLCGGTTVLKLQAVSVANSDILSKVPEYSIIIQFHFKPERAKRCEFESHPGPNSVDLKKYIFACACHSVSLWDRDYPANPLDQKLG